MNKPSIRCAIYTRKSTEEGLEQEFNSLDAQHEACAAYIASQKAEGWIGLPNLYNDGGYSGGTLDRPALTQLLKDIEAGGVDVVVVYKIDRLSRSLLDFTKLIEVLDRKEVTFVSVTQSFNTTTSMGRLTLNVLLSFAQFEREVIGERIRDKFAASKKKGIWMGGNPPLGYDVADRKLVVNPAEAETVRLIYMRYLEMGCARLLAADLKERAIVSKSRKFRDGRPRGGISLNPSGLYCILKNRTYLGETGHKGNYYPGQHEAILSPELFEEVQKRLSELAPKIRVANSSAQITPFGGLLFDETGVQMVPSYTIKRGSIRYRYYVSRSAMKGGRSSASIYRVPAAPFEALVDNAFKRLSLPLGTRQRDYLQRIEILSNSIRMTLDRDATISAWREDSQRSIAERQIFQEKQQVLGGGEQLSLGEKNVVLVLPVRARFHGAQSTISDPAGPPSSLPDKTLLMAIARAHQWRKLLLSGDVGSVESLAQRFGMDRGHVRLTLNFAFINPALTRSIVRGERPHLRISHLAEAALPASWRQQGAKSMLGG